MKPCSPMVSTGSARSHSSTHRRVRPSRTSPSATREDTIVILNITSAIAGAGVSTSSLASCERRSHNASNSRECVSVPKLVS